MTGVLLAFAVTLGSALVVAVLLDAMRRLTRPAFAAVAAAALCAFALSLALRPGSWLVADVLVLAAASVGGRLLAAALRGAPGLVSFLIAAGVVDVLSVYGGLTGRLIASYRDGTSTLLRYLCIAVPVEGTVKPIVGIGDLLVAATVMTALQRLGHTPAACLLVPLGGLAAALTVAFTTGFVAALPLLAVTTVAYLAVDARVRAGRALVLGDRHG